MENVFFFHYTIVYCPLEQFEPSILLVRFKFVLDMLFGFSAQIALCFFFFMFRHLVFFIIFGIWYFVRWYLKNKYTFLPIINLFIELFEAKLEYYQIAVKQKEKKKGQVTGTMESLVASEYPEIAAIYTTISKICAVILFYLFFNIGHNVTRVVWESDFWEGLSLYWVGSSKVAYYANILSEFYFVVGLLSGIMLMALLGCFGMVRHWCSIQYYFVSIYTFLYSLFRENCSQKLYYFYVLMFLVFIHICLFNYLGLLPYTFTLTSHFIFTLNFSFLFFFGLNIYGVYLFGFRFISLFLPAGSPLVISLFLVVIEFVSYLARVFSLAIRLFANLMSGHTLLNILGGFSWVMLISGLSLNLLGGSVVLFVIFIIMFLESAIAFLQAYVFTILLIIYFNDAISALDH